MVAMKGTALQGIFIHSYSYVMMVKDIKVGLRFSKTLPLCFGALEGLNQSFYDNARITLIKCNTSIEK